MQHLVIIFLLIYASLKLCIYMERKKLWISRNVWLCALITGVLIGFIMFS